MGLEKPFIYHVGSSTPLALTVDRHASLRDPLPSGAAAVAAAAAGILDFAVGLLAAPPSTPALSNSGPWFVVVEAEKVAHGRGDARCTCGMLARLDRLGRLPSRRLCFQWDIRERVSRLVAWFAILRGPLLLQLYVF